MERSSKDFVYNAYVIMAMCIMLFINNNYIAPGCTLHYVPCYMTLVNPHNYCEGGALKGAGIVLYQCGN